MQDKIWNQNMAAWKLKLKAKDSSSNETLCTTAKELLFNEIFDLGLEIKIRLCNPNAQPSDPDYGLKEIYFDSFWDGTPDGVDKTETLNWWTDFDWDYSFECSDASKNIPWLSKTEGINPDRSKVHIYQTGLSDQQIDDLESNWAENGIRWRVHVRYRPKTESVSPWTFEFIGGWAELE